MVVAPARPCRPAQSIGARKTFREASAPGSMSLGDRRSAAERGRPAHQLLHLGDPRCAAARLESERRVAGLLVRFPVNLERLGQAPAQDQFRPPLQYVLRLGEGSDQILLAIGLLQAADGEVADGEAGGPGGGEQAGDSGIVKPCRDRIAAAAVGELEVDEGEIGPPSSIAATALSSRWRAR